MEFIFSLETFIFLFFIAITAGIVDTLAGVGGLIVLPALILVGLPPLTALGTNKAQSFAGTGTATYMMLAYKKITVKQMKIVLKIGDDQWQLLRGEGCKYSLRIHSRR